MPAESVTRSRWIIVGGGIAGAATAWALARKGLGPGLILEREATIGAHASGRNASLAHQTEGDPVRRALAMRSMEHIRQLDAGSGRLFQPTGSLLLAGTDSSSELADRDRDCRDAGLLTAVLPRAVACARFAFLERVAFDAALWSPTDGTFDIHALLTRYVELAREDGFTVRTRTAVDGLFIEAGRAAGVHVGDRVIRADAVVDAAGAWAGRLGPAPLPLKAYRRHLFVADAAFVERTWPYTWFLGDEFYFRPEGQGLLLSPCDQTPWPAGDPPTDPAAAESLARKVADHAPGLTDITLRRQWACLRTFAPDRHPVLGPDPDLPGLFHVSGLGGSGMTSSAAVGELVADLVTGGRPATDPAAVSPGRLSRHFGAAIEE